MSEANGNGLTYKWLVGILVTIVLGLTARWGYNVDTRVFNLEKTVEEQTALLAKVDGRQEMMLQSLIEIRGRVERSYEILHKENRNQ